MQLTSADVVLVTGGASGLGAASASALATSGAQVVIVDLPSAAGVDPPRGPGDGSRFLAADVRDEEQVQSAIDAASSLGPLRVVVNCAGIGTPGRIIGKRGVLPLADFQRVIDINLVGTFNV